MGLLVKFKERNLLLNSEVAKDHPQLLAFLTSTPELKESDSYLLSPEMMLFFLATYIIMY